jgi:hypothetical protein
MHEIISLRRSDSKHIQMIQRIFKKSRFNVLSGEIMKGATVEDLQVRFDEERLISLEQNCLDISVTVFGMICELRSDQI